MCQAQKRNFGIANAYGTNKPQDVFRSSNIHYPLPVTPSLKTLSFFLIGFFFLLLVGKEYCCSSPSPKIKGPGNRTKFWATSSQKSPRILHHLHVTHLKVITQENTVWNKLSKVHMPPGNVSQKAVLEWVLYEHKAFIRHCGINAHYQCVTCLFATLICLSRFNDLL